MELDSVCILLSTYNGEKYLKQQIYSIMAQQCMEIILTVWDDGYMRYRKRSNHSVEKILSAEYKKQKKDNKIIP